MSLTTEQVVMVLAKYAMTELKNMTVDEVADELRQSLGEDPTAKEVLENIANDFWMLGFEAGRTVEAITPDQLQKINMDFWVKNLPGVDRLQVEIILRSLGFSYPIV